MGNCAHVPLSDYYGQTDSLRRPHGRGVRLAPDGQIIGEQCGAWKHGVLQSRGWVWRGYLPADTPLSVHARFADVVAHNGIYYVGATGGPLHMPHGFGRTYWPSGALHREGSFVAGRQAGAGVSRCLAGNVYTGHFVNSVREGSGCMQFASGSRYDGEWKLGEQHGIGRSTSAVTGTVYEGQHAHSKLEGLCIQYKQGSTSFKSGEWRGNRFIRSCPVPRSALLADSPCLSAAMRAAGPAILLLPSGGYYSGGTNAAHQRHGAGAVFSAGGTLLQRGRWVEDELVLLSTSLAPSAPLQAAAAATGTYAATGASAAADVSSVQTAAAAELPAAAAATAAAAVVPSASPACSFSECAAAGTYASMGLHAAAAAAFPVHQAAAAAPPAALSSSSECVVCMSAPRDCVISCAHLALCFSCARKLDKCPLCRTPITQIKKLIVA